LSSAAFIVFEVALFGMNRLARVVTPPMTGKFVALFLKTCRRFDTANVAAGSFSTDSAGRGGVADDKNGDSR